MAGTPADLTTYADNNYEHDHTYYGRGCKRDWGTSGESGSQTPCTDSDAGGRYVETADSETQKNGTYYNFQAATVGSGGVITSGDSPNTVCPLGWQLPYSGTDGDYYDKSKSWNYLFTTYGIAFNDGTAVASTKVRSYPFSYVYSGDFNWYSGRLYYQSLRGLHWSSTIVSGEHGGYNLITQYSVVKVIGKYGKSDGLAVRCDFDISILENYPWHPRSFISIMAFHFLKAHFPSVKIVSNRISETKCAIIEKTEDLWQISNWVGMSIL